MNIRIQSASIVLLGLLAATARAAPVPLRFDMRQAPVNARLWPGAIELGLSGSLTAVEGATRGEALLRVGRFFTAARELGGAEAGVGYSHVGSLDRIDAEGALSWQRVLTGTAIYPFIAAAGGIREERLGSFRQARYPVGMNAGVRALFGQRAGLRLEYRFRRILKDPVAEYTEHQALVGLSVFFHNERVVDTRMMFPKIGSAR